MSLRRELEPFADDGHQAEPMTEVLLAAVVAALRHDDRFANVTSLEFELLLADVRAETERALYDATRDRVHLDDVDRIDGGDDVWS